MANPHRSNIPAKPVSPPPKLSPAILCRRNQTVRRFSAPTLPPKPVSPPPKLSPFLSMKLATVSPRLDFNIDDIFAKEVVSAPKTNLPNTVMPPHMMVNSGYPHDMVNSGYVHFNPMQQVVTTSDPLSCFNNGQYAAMWDSDVQNLYSSLGV